MNESWRVRLHCFLVTMGVVFALVPAIADQFALLASTIYVQDAFFWITYSGGWVALLSLLWLFLYFMRVLPSVSAIVWVGLIGGLIMGGPIAIFLFISTFSRFFSENTVLGWHYVSAFLLPVYAPIGLCVALFGGVRRFTGRAEGGRSPH